MVMIQMDLSDEQDKKVEIYKTLHNLKTKADAIAEMIDSTKIDVKLK